MRINYCDYMIFPALLPSSRVSSVRCPLHIATSSTIPLLAFSFQSFSTCQWKGIKYFIEDYINKWPSECRSKSNLQSPTSSNIRGLSIFSSAIALTLCNVAKFFDRCLRALDILHPSFTSLWTLRYMASTFSTVSTEKVVKSVNVQTYFTQYNKIIIRYTVLPRSPSVFPFSLSTSPLKHE